LAKPTTEASTAAATPHPNPLTSQGEGVGTAGQGDGGTNEALQLQAAEREVLAEEAEAFTRTLKDPDARERYARLAEAARQGAVPPALIGSLEAMLELVLQTQRILRLYGPETERVLSDLFYRTPRGAALKRTAREVNRALQTLRGQTLDSLTFSPTPGGQRLVVETQSCQVALTIDPSGVRIDRLDLGA
jgi:hypothetical protein